MSKTTIFTTAVLVLTGMTVIQAGSSNPYCDISPWNLLCLFQKNSWGPNCPSEIHPELSGVTPSDITTILATLNGYRRQVAKGLENRGRPGPQPKASNMRQLVWDEELAMMAQTAAQQCEVNYANNAAVTRFDVRQTINLISSGAKFKWETLFQYYYYDQVTKMPNNVVDNISLAMALADYRNYIQVVWANTYAVGCGFASYGANGLRKMFICHFGPKGILAQEPIYLRGEPGSACPKGTSNSDGLCV